MSEPYLSQVNIFGCNYVPMGWDRCQGQLVAITSYDALFSLIGTTYGGDGRKTFGMPDLRGRTAIGIGEGPGLSNRKIGEKGGFEYIQLTQYTMPSHTHYGTGQATSKGSLSGTPDTSATVKCNNTASSTKEPVGKVWGRFGGRDTFYADEPGGSEEMHAGLVSVNVDLSPVTVDVNTTIDSIGIDSAGGGGPHDNMSPFLAVQFCIATVGLYPTPK